MPEEIKNENEITRQPEEIAPEQETAPVQAPDAPKTQANCIAYGSAIGLAAGIVLGLVTGYVAPFVAGGTLVGFVAGTLLDLKLHKKTPELQTVGSDEKEEQGKE